MCSAQPLTFYFSANKVKLYTQTQGHWGISSKKCIKKQVQIWGRRRRKKKILITVKVSQGF